MLSPELNPFATFVSVKLALCNQIGLGVVEIVWSESGDATRRVRLLKADLRGRSLRKRRARQPYHRLYTASEQ